MDYPEERDTENHARLCPYCNQTFAGGQGLMIHLGQTAGRKNHPANPKSRHEPGDFPRVKVDAEGNVIQAVDTAGTAPTDDREKGAVPTERVFDLIADLVADGETRTAQRVRTALIGVADDTVPSGNVESEYPDLFDALVSYTRENPTDHRVTAAVENGGVMVAYKDHSAFLTAGEARSLAKRLTDIHTSEKLRNADVVHFAEFLEHGADLLEQDETVRGLHEEFNQWD